jgi:hypothetical protein
VLAETNKIEKGLLRKKKLILTKICHIIRMEINFELSNIYSTKIIRTMHSTISPKYILLTSNKIICVRLLA